MASITRWYFLTKSILPPVFHILLSFLLSKKCHNETTICTRVIVIFVNILAIHECTVFIGSKEKRKSVGVFLGMAAG